MEFADPRLIFREGSKPKGPFRFSGSRSDLFAITLHGTYATSEDPPFRWLNFGANDLRRRAVVFTLVQLAMGQKRP